MREVWKHELLMLIAVGVKCVGVKCGQSIELTQNCMKGDLEESTELLPAALALGLLKSLTLLCCLITAAMQFLPLMLPKHRHAVSLVQL